MMELVADVPDTETGALADLVVFEVLVVFQLDELPVVFAEFRQEEADGPRGFEPGEVPVGAAGVIRRIRHLVPGFPLVIAEVIQGEISDRAVKPGFRVGDLLPVRMEPEEGLLDEVFRGFPPAGQTVGEAQQGALFRLEDLSESGFLLIHRGGRQHLRDFNHDWCCDDFHAGEDADSWLSWKKTRQPELSWKFFSRSCGVPHYKEIPGFPCHPPCRVGGPTLESAAT